jgi:hypothetical protein
MTDAGVYCFKLMVVSDLWPLVPGLVRPVRL